MIQDLKDQAGTLRREARQIRRRTNREAKEVAELLEDAAFIIEQLCAALERMNRQSFDTVL